MKLRDNWRDGALFDDAAGTAAATNGAATGAAAAAAKPWYEGKLDADAIGYAQNKGWKLDDPVNFATEAFKAAREAQKFVGVPPEQLLRLPKDAKDENGWKEVWSRLGAPKDPSEYDFSAVKDAAGNAADPSLIETVRQTAAANHLPKDAAAALAAALVKHMEGKAASQAADTAAKLQTEKALLAKNWGKDAEMNKVVAQQGAKRLGITPEAIEAMEKQVGYAAVMEAMRRVGAGTTEDTFVENGSTAPKTVASAQSRLNELMADPAWGKRLTSGDADARREFNSLTEQITGVSSAAA